LVFPAEEFRGVEHCMEAESPERWQHEAGDPDFVAETSSPPQQNPGGIANIKAAKTTTDLPRKAFTASAT
jgi:hypothetical protein